MLFVWRTEGSPKRRRKEATKGEREGKRRSTTRGKDKERRNGAVCCSCSWEQQWRPPQAGDRQQQKTHRSMPLRCGLLSLRSLITVESNHNRIASIQHGFGLIAVSSSLPSRSHCRVHSAWCLIAASSVQCQVSLTADVDSIRSPFDSKSIRFRVRSIRSPFDSESV